MRRLLVVAMLLCGSSRADMITNPHAHGLGSPPPHFVDFGGMSDAQRHAIWVQGVTAYSLTGQLPHTAAWDYLTYRHDLNPTRFDHNHPRLAGLFDKPECVGEVPETPFWEKLEKRHDLNPTRFDHYHPFLGKIMDRNQEAEKGCQEGEHHPPTAVPEPSSIVLGLFGLACAGLVRFLRGG